MLWDYSEDTIIEKIIKLFLNYNPSPLSFSPTKAPNKPITIFF